MVSTSRYALSVKQGIWIVSVLLVTCASTCLYFSLVCLVGYIGSPAYQFTTSQRVALNMGIALLIIFVISTPCGVFVTLFCRQSAISTFSKILWCPFVLSLVAGVFLICTVSNFSGSQACPGWAHLDELLCRSKAERFFGMCICGVAVSCSLWLCNCILFRFYARQRELEFNFGRRGANPMLDLGGERESSSRPPPTMAAQEVSPPLVGSVLAPIHDRSVRIRLNFPMVSTFCYVLSVRQGVWIVSVLLLAYTLTCLFYSFLYLTVKGYTSGYQWTVSQRVALDMGIALLFIFAIFSLCGVIVTVFSRESTVSAFSKVLWCTFVLSLVSGVFLISAISKYTWVQICHASGSPPSEEPDPMCQTDAKYIVGMCIGGVVLSWSLWLYYCILFGSYAQQRELESNFNHRAANPMFEPC